MGYGFHTSELIAQRELDLPSSVDHPVGTLGYTKRVGPDKTIQSSEDVPIESIRNVNLQAQGVTLRERKAFDDGQVLTVVVSTADIAERQRQISKAVSLRCDEAGSVLVEKRSTIEVIVRRVQGSEGPIVLFLASG